ncbi:Glycosyltransferase involved in cell wall bisynthesis [Candidatus Methylobacter favarea]|uniref:Glycosyltransferase involved in cell wall bisynthesis n=1 Tax=Candidatus Methylobacter favarea TaxID=2707345 RepID=A0A8S0X7S1_9GAMM|nr:glycosyltransferase family 4 protein [Candidatus Methylobacter favarea]CAA9890317.1 Glycosyltransferase involved in cell wall bisynthesis [Candidatus Methylobacter favarea]
MAAIKISDIKILMVTRENQADKRYGLGRSLTPLIDEFHRRNIVMDYLCQNDLGISAKAWQQKLHQWLSGSLAKLLIDADCSVLAQVVLERLNMGRLAVKIAAKRGYTHVHCHDPIIAAGVSLCLRFYPRLKIRWGVTEHGFGCYADAIRADGVRLGPRTLKWLRRWEERTLNAAAWVVAPTRSAIVEIGIGLNIACIPENWHHISHARPQINRYSRQESRRRLGWQNDVFYLLGIGRIAPVKQFPLLIEACSHLKKLAVQLVILGEGDCQSLSALGKRFGLERDVLFAATDDIGLYLSAADLYVSASASESFGLANLEAIAAGLPALCTAVGGVPEVMGGGALLVSPELDALADGMRRLLDNRELRESVARQGRLRAETWPDIAEIADNYEKIYR